MKKIISFLCFALLILSGCDKKQPQTTENVLRTEDTLNSETPTISETSKKPSEEPDNDLPPVTKTINIYHPDGDYMNLISTPIECDTITVQGLLEKVKEYCKLPEDIHVISATEIMIQNQKVLSLNLSQEFETYICRMGTSGEFFAIQSIVNTLVDALNVDGIQLTVDGEILETGHCIYDTILTYQKNES